MFFRENLIISKQEAREKFARPESHFVTWEGAEIHYTDEGQGPTMLMVHGFGGNFTNFDSLAAIMKGDYRVVRVDLPGFGLSDLPPQHDSVSVLYHRFFDFFLDTLHIDSLYLVGNSLGGWVSWELAANRPEKVKGLVLLASAGYEINKVKENIGRIDLLGNAFAQKLLERGLPLSFSQNNAHRLLSPSGRQNPEEVRLNNAIVNREGNITNMISLGNSGVEPDTAKITKVACPTLVIWGKNDVIIPWEHSAKFKRDIPHSTIIVYDTCGHIPQIELPRRVARDISQFLSVQ